MRFACFSVEGISLPFWKRLQDEGHDVLVYIDKQAAKTVGEGIVQKTDNYDEFVKWGRNEAIFYFDCTNHGSKADALRRAGQYVFGGGGFCDRLENDRMWGQKLAEDCGIATPKTYPFASISEAQAWLKRRPRGDYYFKPNKDIGTACTCSGSNESLLTILSDIKASFGDRVSNIVQEKLDGVGLSTARYWNGASFVGPFEGTIEHKKLMDNEVGPSTGCSLNIVWYYPEAPDQLVDGLHWDEVENAFRKHNAPPGIYDINALIDKEDETPKFLEWTPRLGFDSEPTGMLGIMSYSNLITALAKGKSVDGLFNTKRVFAGVRLSIPPYPLDDKLVEFIPKTKTPFGLHLQGIPDVYSKTFMGYSLSLNSKGYEVANPNGLLGISCAQGASHVQAFKRCYEQIDGMDIRDLQYRKDAAAIISEDLTELNAMGYDTYA